MTIFVIVIGESIESGLDLVGPFESELEATEYAQSHYSALDWGVYPCMK